MKNGDISNVSSPQLIATTDVVIQLAAKETRGLFQKKIEHSIGDINLLSSNKLWLLSNNYGLSLEMAGFADQGWTEELLDKAFEKLERRVVNPFNYHQLYDNVDELVSLLPYRPNLKGVVDTPERVARYGSFGVEIDNL